LFRTLSTGLSRRLTPVQSTLQLWGTVFLQAMTCIPRLRPFRLNLRAFGFCLPVFFPALAVDPPEGKFLGTVSDPGSDVHLLLIVRDFLPFGLPGVRLCFSPSVSRLPPGRSSFPSDGHCVFRFVSPVNQGPRILGRQREAATFAGHLLRAVSRSWPHPVSILR